MLRNVHLFLAFFCFLAWLALPGLFVRSRPAPVGTIEGEVMGWFQGVSGSSHTNFVGKQANLDDIDDP